MKVPASTVYTHYIKRLKEAITTLQNIALKYDGEKVDELHSIIDELNSMIEEFRRKRTNEHRKIRVNKKVRIRK